MLKGIPERIGSDGSSTVCYMQTASKALQIKGFLCQIFLILLLYFVVLYDIMKYETLV